MLDRRAESNLMQFKFMLILVFVLRLNFCSSQSGKDEGELLLSFKSLINDPTGFFSNWNSSIPFCLWHGITCSNVSKVKAIEVIDKNISGTISSSIFHLPDIETINLSINLLSGEISSDFSSSTSLRCLNLTQNNLRGPTPSCSISMEILDLSNNLFSGKIPAEIGSVCPNLRIVNLAGNELVGNIPRSISNMSSLQFLTLAANNLVGQIPHEFGKMKSLKFIYLGYNKLSGKIPQELGNLVSLYHLDLVHNNLTGQIPSTLGNLTNLQYLYLFDNMLTGSIPISMFGLKKLINLDLSENYLCDEIPELINGLLSLEILQLFFNNFTGKFPKALVSLPHLKHLGLAHNRFSGEVPSFICNFSSIEVLSLGDNLFSGTIPQCLGTFSKQLSILDLGKNNFHGALLQTFIEDCGLRYLIIDHNKFEVFFSQSLANCRSLEILDISHNGIIGTFPYWLETLPELQVLLLRSNKFHGRIQSSKSIKTFSKLRILDIANNEFTGLFPKGIIENMKALMHMNQEKNSQYMKGNLFIYYLVFSIKGISTRLRILTTLSAIDLSNNNFQGTIPNVFGRFCSLRGLNISHNSFSGHIPASMGNMTNLEWLDLSSNMLIGQIPNQLTDLTFLAFLNLSYNQLTGSIPQDKQFSTFENSSYEGNLALCGLPLSTACNDNNGHKQSPALLNEADRSEIKITFGWKVVLLGYGCGIIFGIIVGYVSFRNGEPNWYIRLFGVKYHQWKAIRHRRNQGNSQHVMC